jgi:hypothetical protein
MEFFAGIIFPVLTKCFMKKYLLAILLFASVLSFSCGNSNTSVNKTDTTTVGNTDSSGSQPVQSPGPGAANGGNATDTIAHETTPAPRTDSVIKH